MPLNIFSADLERDAFRASNGEFGWTRGQIPRAVAALTSHGFGILGGELWWIPSGSSEWTGLIPQQHGAPGVYSWETIRKSGEAWESFVQRSAADARAAVERWPTLGDLPPDLAGRILYNLTFVSQTENDKSIQKTLEEIGEYGASRNPGYTQADVPRLIKEVRRDEPSRRRARHGR